VKKLALYVFILAFVAVFCADAFGLERFPPPEFDTYQIPSTEVPAPSSPLLEYVDSVVLGTALLLAAYLVLKKRNRRWIFSLMIFSMIYFGFYRKGCVCSIGAIGNVCLSIFDADYAMGVTAVIFFILPLIVTLFFGRVFCGAVCPLGAIQDAVLLKPVAVPSWLEKSLRILAYIYLAAAVLFAATGSAFVICRYDPFIGFFRVSAGINMVVLGICFLVVGVFVGRPYCRFLCPYGVILRQFSRLSKYRVTVTPDDCIKCRLCEDACPFGAIDKPTADWPAENYIADKKRLAVILLIAPVLIAVMAWAGYAASDKLARVNTTVTLADRVYLEETGAETGTTDASAAFRSTGETIDQLYARTEKLMSDFAIGSALCGAFVGLIIVIKLILESIRWKRTDYEANRAGCFACGRCFKYCPKEQQRLKG
jgi:polyferredoxin